MTQILTSDYSDVNAPKWTYDTLKPPKLSLYNLYKDIKWHLSLYRNAKLPLKVRIQFVYLRIIQRINYNKGWKEGGKKFNK